MGFSFLVCYYITFSYHEQMVSFYNQSYNFGVLTRQALKSGLSFQCRGFFCQRIGKLLIYGRRLFDVVCKLPERLTQREPIKES